ncbi:hypothetical protein ACNO7T_15770 [Vibrio campbellii]
MMFTGLKIEVLRNEDVVVTKEDHTLYLTKQQWLDLRKKCAERVTKSGTKKSEYNLHEELEKIFKSLENA